MLLGMLLQTLKDVRDRRYRTTNEQVPHTYSCRSLMQKIHSDENLVFVCSLLNICRHHLEEQPQNCNGVNVIILKEYTPFKTRSHTQYMT